MRNLFMYWSVPSPFYVCIKFSSDLTKKEINNLNIQYDIKFFLFASNLCYGDEMWTISFYFIFVF
jgi:hypothetical protein